MLFNKSHIIIGEKYYQQANRQAIKQTNEYINGISLLKHVSFGIQKEPVTVLASRNYYGVLDFCLEQCYLQYVSYNRAELLSFTGLM